MKKLSPPKKMTEREEAEYWFRMKPSPADDAVWEEVKYVPRATIGGRNHVYRVKLDDEEMGGLQALSKKRKVSASVVIREMLRKEISELRR